MTPDDEVPRRMVDALYFVHEMATDDGMEELLARAGQSGIDLDPDPQMTPADVAIDVWLNEPNLLEEAHAEALAKRKKSFRYYSGKGDAKRPFVMPMRAKLAAIAQDLDAWFDKNKRGRESRVFAFDYGRKVRFLVWHGAPFRREGSVKHGRPSSAYYRPDVHDILIYDREADEVGVHTKTVGELKLYLRVFGQHLFLDEEHFPFGDKFTAEPLLERGAEALACDDVDGLDAVVLVEYERRPRSGFKEALSHKATDVLAALAARKRELPRDRITKCVFALHLTGVEKPRSLTIRPPNVALYEHDENSPILEEWMVRRGFMLRRTVPHDEALVELLAGD